MVEKGDKKKKYFKDEYPDYEGGYKTKGDFDGLIPSLIQFIKIFVSIVAAFFEFVSKFIKPVIIIIIGFFVVKYGFEYAPTLISETHRIVQEKKWDESPEELLSKDYLVATEWGVCYQQLLPKRGKKVCLRTDIGFLEYGLSWRGFFERDERGNVNILLRYYDSYFADFFGPKDRIIFYHNENGRRVMKAHKSIKPFSCTKGTWRFTQDSIHKRAISYLKVNPKIIFSGRDCPTLLISFIKP